MIGDYVIVGLLLGLVVAGWGLCVWSVWRHER